jgi:hypothetical protein
MSGAKVKDDRNNADFRLRPEISVEDYHPYNEAEAFAKKLYYNKQILYVSFTLAYNTQYL